MSKSNKYFSTDPSGPILRDAQHASRLFTESDLRLAPKSKFLYHVRFNIDPSAVSSLNLRFRHQNEINMLVKTAELPKFSVQTETLNQYNRKKNTQVKIDYQPVMIKFHDDNFGVTRQLWENYFDYYYGDPSAAKSLTAYSRNAMQSPSFIRQRYGLDNNSSIPFFRDITIYQMGKRSWNSYKLINPLISAWNHDSLDYSSNQSSEQTMTLIYEAVAYGAGVVSQGNPPGFAQEHYDNTPSPAGIEGFGRTSPRSQGSETLSNVLGGAQAVFGAIANGSAFSSPGNAIATALTAVNTYQNAKRLKGQLGNEVGNLILGGAERATRLGSLGGVQNTSFPVSNPQQTTVAAQRNVTGTGR